MPARVSRSVHISGVTRAELTRYRTLGLVSAAPDEPDEETLRRARRIRRLHRDLGLSYDAIALVVRLVERIEELESVTAQAARVRIVGL